MNYHLLNEAPCHEDVWGVEVWLHALLISALDGGEWLVMTQLLYPQERAHSTHLIGSWVGPRTSLDAVVK